MKKRLSRLISDGKNSLVEKALQGIKGGIPGCLDFSCLLETLIGCIASVLTAGRSMLPDCRNQLGWDLPDAPSLQRTHSILIALKREIVRMLEREFEREPHLLVQAICELEDALDTVLAFLLEEEEKSAGHTDLLRLGESLSQTYTDDIISIYDREGKLVYQSPSIEKILGYTPSEWRERGPHLTIENPMYEVVEQEDNGAPHLENVAYMVVIPHKNGGEKIVEVEEKFIHGAGKQIIGLWTKMRDVSVRENLKQELKSTHQKYEEIFEEAADVMFVLDVQGKLQAVNRRFRELTGFSSEYLGGKPLDVLIHKNDRQNCMSQIEKLLLGQTVEFEARIFSVSGSHIISSFRCKPLQKNGTQWIFIGIARDIAEKRRIEEELERKVDLLDRYRRASADREMRIRELLDQLEKARGGEKNDR
jgi:PAS domain S-box-containing protein